MMNSVPVEKDEDREHAIPSAWREVFCQIVDHIVSGDLSKLDEISGVRSVSLLDEERIFENIFEYGEDLVRLPEEAWLSSVCQWQTTYWDVLVDLFTTQGESDLVLSARVYEGCGEGYDYIYEVISIHVP